MWEVCPRSRASATLPPTMLTLVASLVIFALIGSCNSSDDAGTSVAGTPPLTEAPTEDHSTHAGHSSASAASTSSPAASSRSAASPATYRETLNRLLIEYQTAFTIIGAVFQQPEPMVETCRRNAVDTFQLLTLITTRTRQLQPASCARAVQDELLKAADTYDRAVADFTDGLAADRETAISDSQRALQVGNESFERAVQLASVLRC